MDLRAFRQAVDILVAGKYPLVIFPEGEVYHINDRVTPFRYGAAAIAISAARRIGGPVNVIPTALKYHYLGDPIPALKETMDRLESCIHWRPKRSMPLAERIYRFAEGALAIKELEYVGRTSAGPLPERVVALRDYILQQLEDRFGARAKKNTPPERIKFLRHRIITLLSQLPPADASRSQHLDGLDDLLFVTQLFSYPGDYVAEAPTIERIAETIDKFAEDALCVSQVSRCADRMATVCLGTPLQVAAGNGRHDDTARLVHLLERKVQHLLDSIPPPRQRPIGARSNTKDVA
jgi:1-acyl-sn-glycerol-3-phosphate acyltransferase